MARSSFASSGVIPTSPERQSHITERFDVLQASAGISSQTRLQQPKRRFSICDSDTFVSTAIAPNKWVAAATPSEIRLYNIENQDINHDVKPGASIRLKSMSKGESVRAVAISDDLLAVVTHLRLIIYEYLEAGNIENNMLPVVSIDQKASWTPRTVSILQVDSTDANQSAAAWIAIGGEGVNGVKLYQYSRNPGWTALRNCRLTLRSPQNTGLVQSVGFSTFLRLNSFVVFAVTSENRVNWWWVRSREIGAPESINHTEYDTRASQNPSSHRGEITAVNVFESPSGKAYMLVGINQKHGSPLIRSSITPLGAPRPQWKSLPDTVVGRQCLSAAATPNGRFLVVVEGGSLKLLALRGALDGGLTCSEHTVKWKSYLSETAKDICAISLSVKESRSCIEITGVDGRGHLIYARASVPGMPVTTPPSLTRRPFEMAELHGDSIASVVPELCGREVHHAPRVDSTVGSDWERLSEDIEVMLGS